MNARENGALIASQQPGSAEQKRVLTNKRLVDRENAIHLPPARLPRVPNAHPSAFDGNQKLMLLLCDGEGNDNEKSPPRAPDGFCGLGGLFVVGTPDNF